MKPRINAVYLTVQDMERAVKFYEEILEMQVTKLHHRMSEFRIGEFTLLLYDPKVDNFQPVIGDNCVINIEVDDIEKSFELVKSIGCQVVLPITKIDVDLVFQVEDTEGNTIEFYQVINTAGN